ncbi:MAG: zinc ABC transporter substrate-binding protein [Bacteroidota bacterium]
MKKSSLLKKILWFGIMIFPIIILIHLSMDKRQNEKNAGQIRILATTSIIADVLQHIVKGVKGVNGKQMVYIHTMINIGVDPHGYESTPKDAQACNEADVIFVSGLNLEGTMGEIFINFKKIKPVYVATNSLKKHQIRKDEAHSIGVDPHWWCNPKLMIQVVTDMVGILQKLDPAHAQAYAENGQKYIAGLQDLNSYIIKKLKAFPGKKLIIITNHDFLGYFADAYDKVEVRALQGFTTASDISLRRRESLTKDIIKNNVKVIFLEQGVNQRGLASLVESCKIKGHRLQISKDPLYGDSIGPLNTSAGTYIGMITHNVNVLTKQPCA